MNVNVICKKLWREGPWTRTGVATYALDDIYVHVIRRNVDK